MDYPRRQNEKIWLPHCAVDSRARGQRAFVSCSALRWALDGEIKQLMDLSADWYRIVRGNGVVQMMHYRRETLGRKFMLVPSSRQVGTSYDSYDEMV